MTPRILTDNPFAPQMARRRTGTVSEPTESLARIERNLAEPEKARRIRFLSLIRNDPGLTYEQIASELGSTGRTVRRWWRVYQEGGLHGLLKLKEESIPTSTEQGPRPLESTRSDQELVAFLNSLQPTANPTEWIRALRTALAMYLPGVDRVSIVLAATRGMVHGTGRHAALIVRQVLDVENDPRHQPPISVTSLPGVAGVIQTMRSSGLPVDDYHDPIVVQIEVREESVGSILLWAEKQHSRIPSETLALIDSIRPFIGYLLMDGLLRIRMSTPGLNTISEALSEIMTRFALTERELQVLTLHIFGRTHSEIAERLFLSINTVRKHVKSLHRKTRCSTYNELLAMYLSPLSSSERS